MLLIFFSDSREPPNAVWRMSAISKWSNFIFIFSFFFFISSSAVYTFNWQPVDLLVAAKKNENIAGFRVNEVKKICSNLHFFLIYICCKLTRQFHQQLVTSYNKKSVEMLTIMTHIGEWVLWHFYATCIICALCQVWDDEGIFTLW